MPSRSGVRGAICVLCLAAACVLTPVVVAAQWVDRVALDTAGYVRAVAPLAHDPSIRAEITDQVTKRVIDRVGDGVVIGELLPKRLAPMSSLLIAAGRPFIRPYIREQVTSFVDSAAFPPLWVAANEQAHAAFLAASSKGGDPAAGRIDVRVDLRPAVEAVASRAGSLGPALRAGLARVDTTVGFELLDPGDFAWERRLASGLDRAAPYLPAVEIILLVAGLSLARRRARAAVWTGLFAALGMSALLLAIQPARSVFLAHVVHRDISVAAGSAMFDAVTSPMVSWAVAVLAAAVALAASAALVGPVRRLVERISPASRRSAVA